MYTSLSLSLSLSLSSRYLLRNRPEEVTDQFKEKTYKALVPFIKLLSVMNVTDFKDDTSSIFCVCRIWTL